ncbi:MAG: hypothetical protein HBSAPP03_26000 [Phycisphaerae bacterium]|nr:MAG: hypothetical protein HBSAPP03_26000 [Phycisphaerae bacterium]
MKRVACWGAAALAVAACGSWWLASTQPEWWQAAQAPDAAVRAERIENAVVTELSAVRAEEAPWTVALSEEDVNAWLEARLVKWLENRGERWPERVSPPRVVLLDGVMRAAVEIGGGGRVVVVEMKPRVDDGGLWLDVRGVWIGRLRVPVAAVRAAWPSGLGKFAGVLSGERPVSPEAGMAVDGARRVRVLALTPRPGRLEVQARTERR